MLFHEYHRGVRNHGESCEVAAFRCFVMLELDVRLPELGGIL